MTEAKLKDVLSTYGNTVNITITPSRTPGSVNAVVNFSEETAFKNLLADYLYDQKLSTLFLGKPRVDMHMSAKDRNEYK